MIRTVKLGAFNIVTHPHSPEQYLELFQHGRKLKQSIKIRGETHGVLATVYKPNDEGAKDVVTGEIFTFLQLDTELDWYDIFRGEQATEEQVEEVHIPDELRPHLKKIRYALFPADHLFVYTVEDSQHDGISPTPMGSFLERLLNDNRLLEKTNFQSVEVRLVQDRKTLDTILETLNIELLEIVVRRPNPGDTPEEADKLVEEEMRAEELEQVQIIKKAAREKAIKPNERTLKYMEAATSNGYVKAKGLTADGKKHEFNTEHTPLIEPFEFSTKVPYLRRFLEVAGQVRDIVRRK